MASQESRPTVASRLRSLFGVALVCLLGGAGLTLVEGGSVSVEAAGGAVGGALAWLAAFAGGLILSSRDLVWLLVFIGAPLVYGVARARARLAIRRTRRERA